MKYALMSVMCVLAAGPVFGVTFTENFEGNWYDGSTWTLVGPHANDGGILINDPTQDGALQDRSNELWGWDTNNGDYAGGVRWEGDTLVPDDGKEIIFLDYNMQLAPNTTYTIENIAFDTVLFRTNGAPPEYDQVWYGDPDGPNTPQDQRTTSTPYDIGGKYDVAQIAYIGAAEDMAITGSNTTGAPQGWQGYSWSGEGGSSNTYADQMLGLQWNRYPWNDESSSIDDDIINHSKVRPGSFTETINGNTEFTTGPSGIATFRLSTWVKVYSTYHTSAIDNLSITLTPEPASLGFLAIGSMFVLLRRRR